ncbi:TrbG/VirB9 family P-type conjugative transfer protein [Ensifer sp. SL37]|uniref:TrbG/VirB9 family P-type conjugative transfer protein n=1 Tax=Ensifer sp. SL37 TaxID=2995137 RepID=UPI002274A088|nr:TrbG/VirB9 family P-type conjugative transfer protein [Ensifer sp. SL37]MCY1741007.1 TrbG/VirB9 family P-type conjugative transfer protein [Ensifer sp. SL37]
MKRSLIWTALLSIGVAGSALAEAVPPSGRYDNRVRNASYVDGQVYRVNTGVMRVTSIEFGVGEEIVSIVAGDTEGYKYDAVPGGRALVVKPLLAGATTNMTVYTNLRAYYLQLQESGRGANYVVRFNGGVAAQSKAGADQPIKTVQKSAPYTRYGANVLTDITPQQVSDDGAFTYFHFSLRGEVPAIFKTTTGVEKTVNSTTMPDGTVRVSGISRYWVVRLGKSEAVIKRMEPAR